MAFHHLLMGKSVSLRVLSVVGSLEWSTISKCGAISEEKIIALTSIPMNMLHLMMRLKVALACLLVASYYWFMSTSLLTQILLSRFPHPGFGRRCCPWTYWSSCVSVKKPTGSSFPESGFTCLFVYIFELCFPLCFLISHIWLFYCTLSSSSTELLHFKSYRKPLSTSDWCGHLSASSKLSFIVLEYKGARVQKSLVKN